MTFASPPGVATGFARRAVAELPDHLADHRQGLLALQRMGGFLHSLEDGWSTPAPDPDGTGPGAQMLAATVALQAFADGADRELATTMARRAHEDDRLMAVDDGLFWINAAIVRTLADDPLGDFWIRARGAAAARGSLFATLSINVWEGFWRWQRGELDEALACLDDALEQDHMWGGTDIGKAMTRAFQIGCHLDRGDAAAARRVADVAGTHVPSGEGGRVLQQAMARLLVAEGSSEAALTRLDAIPPGIAIVNPVWNPWREIRAAALDAMNRTPDAVALAEEQVRLLRRWGAPSYLGRGLCQLGELRGEDGVDDLREAVRLLAGTTAAVALARAQCALGGLARVADVQAVPLLLEAHRSAEQSGAAGLHTLAQELLGQRGHPVESCAEHTRRLTATERRIVELAGAGLEHSEIARRVFVTPATVRRVLDEVADSADAPVSSPSQPAPAMIGDPAARRRP